MKTTLVLIVVLLFTPGTFAQAPIIYGSNKETGKYTDVNDIKVYYEIYGKGEPMLLLHGNGGSIENFMFQIPELSKHFKVIAVDSRAQGRSTDSDKEISYALMASDMSALIHQLNLGSVFVVGWSDGGNIGLELAYAHPEQVKKLVIFGANFTHDNYVVPPDSILMDPNDPLVIQTREFSKLYRSAAERLSPNPERLPEISKKLNDLMEKYPNFTPDQLGKIKTPVLVVVGDHDIISMDHTVSLFTHLKHAELFVVPGATHLVPAEKPELVNSVIVQFFKNPYRDIDRYYFFK